jgi:hypothetical protein
MGSTLKRCKEQSIHKICALLGYYAVQSGNSLPVFWENLLVPSSRILDFLILEDGTTKKSRNIVRNYHEMLHIPG